MSSEPTAPNVALEHPYEPEPARLSVARSLEACLALHEIDRAFTLPGAQLQPLLRELHLGRRMRCVLARQESSALMMADGYFRATGRPALAAVTAGPGVTNAVNGIALAHVEQSAVILLTGQVSRAWLGRGAAQELDAARLLAPITKRSVTLDDPDKAWSTLSELIALSTEGRPGPVHLCVPADLWNTETSAHSSGLSPSSDATNTRARLAPAAPRGDVQALAQAIERAAHPVVLVGYGVVLARAESALLSLARKVPKLRFACTPRSKGAFPENHPSSLGVFGLAGHDAAEHALLEQSDLVVVLGSRLGECSTLGWDERLGQRPLAQVDLDANAIGLNYLVQFPIHADVRSVLRQLCQSASAQSPQAGAAAAEVNTPAEAVTVPEAGTSETTQEPPIEAPFVHPRDVVEALNRTLRGKGDVWSDIGNSMAWLLHHLHCNLPGRWHLNLNWGSMGHALPAAIGAVSATGERAVVVVGDAAFAMTGFELHTAVEERLPLVVVVLNDSGHGMVELGSKEVFGPDQVPSARFRQRIDAAELAHALGAPSTRVSTLAALEAGLAHAWSSVGKARLPHVLDVHIDPTAVPPFGSRMRALKQNFTGER